MKRNTLILRMAVLACFMALIAILTFVPYVGFIPLGFVSVTIIHVVIIIGAITLGKVNGAILGLFMGICSLAHSYIGTSNDVTFVFPWVSILPRVIFGYLTGIIYELFKNIKNTYIRLLLTSIISTITHTLLVFIVYVPTFSYLVCDVSMFTTFSGSIGLNDVSLPIVFYCLASFMFSCIFEAILAAIICPFATIALKSNHRVNKVLEKVYR